MDATFEVFSLQSPNCRFLIINKDFNSLGDKLFYINKTLTQKKYKGDVIFNTLTSTCDRNRQYSKVYFDGTQIQLKSLTPLNIVDKNIEAMVNDYFSQNRALLESLPFSIM